jgi:hypothetical protein
MGTARSSMSSASIPAETDADFDAVDTQSDESEDYEADSSGRGKLIKSTFLLGHD